MHPADEFLTAFSARDWDRVRRCFAPGATWTMPGNGPLSGTVRGPEAMTDRAAYIVAQGVETEFDVRLTGEHGAAFVLRNSAQRDGVELDERLATVVTVEGDLVTRIDSYLSDVDGKDNFFT